MLRDDVEHISRRFSFGIHINLQLLIILTRKGAITMSENSGRKKTASKVDWILAGNKTVVPKGATPSKMNENIAIRRNRYEKDGGVHHPSNADVEQAKEFVDSNHKA